MDQMEKVCSSRLERVDKRHGLLECSCSSINALVRTIHNAKEGSFAPITQVA